METDNLTLSQSDVEKLMADPSPGVRAETTSKLAAQYERKFPRLTPAERQLAEDIFRTLTKDMEVIVRQALSQHLKTADDLPNDVAVALAKDVDAVALPMIKFSVVLSDDDLMMIIDSNSGSKQVAVAGREQVSGRVADALLDTGNESAVARLVANEGADLDNDHFGRVLDEYKDSNAVSSSLNRRPSLPPQLSERLMTVVTEKLQDYLVSEHDLAPDLASNVILQARERATVTLLSEGSSDEELERLVAQLHAKGRLTPSLTLRALCMGDQAFFEVATARLAGVPLHNARILIHDQGSLGMESLYERTGLPPGLFPAFRAAIYLRRETDYDGLAYDRERFMSKMIERILTQFEEPDSNLTQADIDYLLGKLKDLAA